MSTRGSQIRFNATLRAIRCALLLAFGTMHAPYGLSGESKPLTAAVIRGSTVYSPTEFYKAYRARLGRRADNSTAKAVIADIEAMYVRDGYARPGIQVWDDLLGDGILRIDLHEAWLVDVAVKGDTGPYAGKVDNISRVLMTELPLRTGSIPKALQTLRALPGLELEANVTEQPGSHGAMVLQLKAAYRPVSASVRWSNRGTHEVGPDLISAQVVENNLLNANERMGAFATTTRQVDEYHAVGGFVELPLGQDGPTLSLSGMHSNSRPTLGGARYDLFNPQDWVGLSVTRRLVVTEGLALSAALGAELQNMKITFSGIELESDRLRIGKADLWLEGVAGKRGAYSVSAGWRRGLAALHSRISFVDGSTLSPVFNIGTADFAYARSLGHGWRWRVEARGQSSSRRLPYAEQFKVGGIQLGRGLATSVLSGDSGAGAKFELSYQLGAMPQWLGTPALFGYSDYGTVWLRGAPGREYIATAGIGVQSRFSWGRLAAEVGKPVAFSQQRPAGTTVFGEARMDF